MVVAPFDSSRSCDHYPTPVVPARVVRLGEAAAAGDGIGHVGDDSDEEGDGHEGEEGGDHLVLLLWVGAALFDEPTLGSRGPPREGQATKCGKSGAKCRDGGYVPSRALGR